MVHHVIETELPTEREEAEWNQQLATYMIAILLHPTRQSAQLAVERARDYLRSHNLVLTRIGPARLRTTNRAAA